MILINPAVIFGDRWGVTDNNPKLVQIRRDYATVRDRAQADTRINFCTDIDIGRCLDGRTLNACVEHIENLGKLYGW